MSWIPGVIKFGLMVWGIEEGVKTSINLFKGDPELEAGLREYMGTKDRLAKEASVARAALTTMKKQDKNLIRRMEDIREKQAMETRSNLALSMLGSQTSQAGPGLQAAGMASVQAASGPPPMPQTTIQFNPKYPVSALMQL